MLHSRTFVLALRQNSFKQNQYPKERKKVITQKQFMDQLEQELQEDTKQHHGGYGAALAFSKREMPWEEKQKIHGRYRWIRELFANKKAPCHSMHVSSVLLDILELSPTETRYGSAKERIYFVDERGHALWWEEEVIFGRLFFWKDQPVRRQVIFLPEHMKIRDGFKMLGDDANKVRWIVSYSKVTCALIIYEPPSNKFFLEWINMLRSKHGTELAEAIRNTDELVSRYPR